MYMLWFNFILGLNCIIPFFLVMVMYDNDFETKENIIEPKIKLNHNIYKATKGYNTL